MTKLTMVSIRNGHSFRTWFVNLPVIDSAEPLAKEPISLTPDPAFMNAIIAWMPVTLHG